MCTKRFDYIQYSIYIYIHDMRVCVCALYLSLYPSRLSHNTGGRLWIVKMRRGPNMTQPLENEPTAF